MSRRLLIALLILIILIVLTLFIFVTVIRAPQTPTGTPAPALTASPTPESTAKSTATVQVVATTPAPRPPTGVPTIVPSAISNSVAGILPAPDNVTVTPGDTVLTITWSAVLGTSGYLIFRNGESAPLNAVIVTETSYQDIGLSNGRAYTYTVAAVNAQGRPGSLSQPVIASPTP